MSRVRIITYHRVNDYKWDTVSISTSNFEQQIRYIVNNFKPISFEKLCSVKSEKCSSLPLIIVSFDDGFEDNFIHAMPILKKYGLPACFFVCSGYINTHRNFEWNEKRGWNFRNMTWDQIALLAEAGFEIGAHTVNHINVGHIDRKKAEKEILKSKKDIESKIKQNVQVFAFPYGRHSDISYSYSTFLKKHFEFSCTTIRGFNDTSCGDNFYLNRSIISGHDTFYEFIGELYGVYDIFDRWYEYKIGYKKY